MLPRYRAEGWRLVRGHRRGRADVGTAGNVGQAIGRGRRRREGEKGKDRGRAKRSEKKNERRMTWRGGGVDGCEAGVEAG